MINNKLLYIFIIFWLICLTGCDERRLELIQDYSGLQLPGKYQILTNKTESEGFAGADFTVTIALKFDDNEFKKLVNNLEKIKKSTQYGQWIKVKNKYEFRSNPALLHSSGETVEMDIDKTENILKF